ncbi:ABC transporter ATP-binding protein [Komagataeibacter swingsii]|uniref:Spermidine/putrescine ABC transporter ATP-binding protein n=1 Tax=Komagataeibacter swingsii TaxID=215220 RepID=A0A2V4QXM3_9PROT|nr:ABC transporter ATP-binding protein [Komagataeibacter swingsii]PYD68197.1 spermidine/putrescine ABC transporter ATP-binding protein [Komagataeibacter swingsii]GBQ57517.1 nitrate/sulfonate/bicarbonate transporter ATP-binding protein [Komagataeibacter swingsii DSM 16373]
MNGQHDALVIDAVGKQYGDFTALAPTSLTVCRGEFVSLLGPSGSGKTTLLMMIAGLATPDCGSIWIDGTDATRLPPNRRDIGVVFQNYALFPHMSIFQNIAFPLQQRHVPGGEIRRRVEHILEVVGLSHVADRLPAALSGGQQQRIALARCLVYRPSLILMDEPLGALDKRMRDQLQDEIRRTHCELGTTIVYVTHDQHEALTMSDRICLMNHGRIEQVETPQRLYARPRSVFSACFLGESNIFKPVSIVSDHGGWRFAMAEGQAPFLAGPRADMTDPSAFLVRPENMRIGPGTGLEDNRIDVTVSDILFMGTTTRYRVEAPWGQSLLVDALSGSDMADVHVGATVGVCWNASNTVALLDNGAP